MATQGRPNISLLPIAGAEITRARERQQAVGLQAAMARLQAQAQAAALEERAREFDINAQLRQEATALDERFRQQQLGFQRQQFQQRTQQARFAQELDVERLGLQEQGLRLSFERESRIAEQAEQEFGFRSEQFVEAKRRADVAEKRLTRTEAQKRFQTFFDLFKETEGTLFTVDPDAPRGRMVTFDQTKAAPLLEQMAEAFSQAFGRDFSINELQQLLNPQLTRAVEERQFQRGQRTLASDVQRQNIAESETRAFKNLQEPAARAPRVTPQQQVAQTLAQERFQRARGIDQRIASFDLGPEREQQLGAEAAALRAEGESLLRQAVAPVGPSPAELLAPTRQEQFQQFIDKPRVAGAPSAAEQAAAPTDFGAQVRGDVRQFLQETQEEAQGFQSPSQAAETISPQDRVAMQGYIDNGLRVLDVETQDAFFANLLEQVATKKNEVQEAFAIKKQDPPARIIQALDAQARQLRAQRSQGQIDIEDTRKRQQQALNNMTSEGALVLRAQLTNEHTELNDLLKQLDGRKDAATDDIEREQIQGQIDGANKTLAHLGEMRNKVAEKASQSRTEFFNIDRTATTIKAAFRGIPATSPEVKGVMSELSLDVDRVVAEKWGETEFFSTQSGSRVAKRQRGEQYIRWLREGGIWSAWGKEGDTVELSVLADDVVLGRAAIGLVTVPFLAPAVVVPRAFRAIKEVVTGRVPETDLIAGFKTALPFDQREVFEGALERFEGKPNIVRDPQTGEERLAAQTAEFREAEITREEMLRVTQIQLAQENPENIVAHALALLIKGRDKGIDVVDVWRTVAPFDYYGYVPDPRRAADPVRDSTDMANLFD